MPTSLTCALNSLISKAQDGKMKCDAPQPAEMYQKKERERETPVTRFLQCTRRVRRESAILPDIEDGKRAKKCLRHWAPQSREFSCSTAPRMQQMVASSLPPQHSTPQVACLTYLLQFKKKSGNRQRPTDSGREQQTGLGRLLSWPCPGVLVGKGGRVGGDGVVDNSREREITAKLAFGRPHNTTSAKTTSPSAVTRVRSHDPFHSTLFGFHFSHIIVELQLALKL